MAGQAPRRRNNFRDVEGGIAALASRYGEDNSADAVRKVVTASSGGSSGLSDSLDILATGERNPRDGRRFLASSRKGMHIYSAIQYHWLYFPTYSVSFSPETILITQPPGCHRFP
eukprot:1392562-Amorphochlora_amoeboformis.AAC.2